MSKRVLLPRVQRGRDDRFVPGERNAIVSLPWWDEDLGEVVFVDPGNGWERTIVVSWPTWGALGRELDVAAIRAGKGVEVLPWDIRPATRDRLATIARSWPPADHDLYVRGAPEAPRLVPAHRGLLGIDLGLDIAARVEWAIRRWCTLEAASPPVLRLEIGGESAHGLPALARERR